MKRYLLDANILLRFLEEKDAEHTEVVSALETLLDSDATLFLSAQNLIEFWSVASRPQNANGFGWDNARCVQSLSLMMTTFDFAEDNADVFRHWRRLVETYGVSGRQVHDARLVAVMKAHNIERILTLNDRDFARYVKGEKVIVVKPRNVLEET